MTLLSNLSNSHITIELWNIRNLCISLGPNIKDNTKQVVLNIYIQGRPALSLNIL